MSRFCAVALCAIAMTGGCNEVASSEGNSSEPAGVTPTENALPPLELRDDTKDLLLTWVDDDGDFHVVQKIADVPEANREKVRVVVTTRSEGTGRLVYVADLRKQERAAYSVATMTRAQWDELGASKRKMRLEALAPSARPPAPPASAAATGPLKAVVYGADWCKPCHDAERLLKSLGVAVTKKDIEKSTAARTEMKRKLAKIRRVGASIPVIDVMGRVFVGYSPSALRRAVNAAKQAETL